jgi:hypothetical protein
VRRQNELISQEHELFMQGYSRWDQERQHYEAEQTLGGWSLGSSIQISELDNLLAALPSRINGPPSEAAATALGKGYVIWADAWEGTTEVDLWWAGGQWMESRPATSTIQLDAAVIRPPVEQRAPDTRYWENLILSQAKQLADASPTEILDHWHNGGWGILPIEPRLCRDEHSPPYPFGVLDLLITASEDIFVPVFLAIGCTHVEGLAGSDLVLALASGVTGEALSSILGEEASPEALLAARGDDVISALGLDPGRLRNTIVEYDALPFNRTHYEHTRPLRMRR